MNFNFQLPSHPILLSHGLCLRERAVGLLQTVADRGDVDKHECFGKTPQRVAHEHRELVVAVGDVRGVGGERIDDIAQSGERLVDGQRLLQLLAG